MFLPLWGACSVTEALTIIEADQHPSYQSPCVDSLTLKALIGTASSKERGWNAEIEFTTRAWHEGLRKLGLF